MYLLLYQARTEKFVLVFQYILQSTFLANGQVFFYKHAWKSVNYGFVALEKQKQLTFFFLWKGSQEGKIKYELRQMCFMYCARLHARM